LAPTLSFMKEPNIEIDCYFIIEKLKFGDITTRNVNSCKQLADILTESIKGQRINHICSKLNTWLICS